MSKAAIYVDEERKAESAAPVKRGASPSRILELDGLRGAAVLTVIVFHNFAYVPGGQPGSFLSRFQRLFSMGWTGVDLFFVLSGFLIGGILLDARASQSYFRTFYLRRFFRIIPLYYLFILGYVLVVAIAGKSLAASEATAPQLHFSLVRQFLFLQNSTFVPDVGLALAWFAPTWSLAVEEQFYLVSPLLVRFLSVRALSIVLSFAILAVPFFRLFVIGHVPAPYGPNYVYHLTLCRMDALALGMLGAIVWRNPETRQWIGSHAAALYGSFAVLFVGVAGLWRFSTDQLSIAMQGFGYSWMALFFTTLVLLVLARPAGPIAWVARMGWLRELGKVSYCMYLIHQAVNLFCHILILGTAPQIGTWPGMLVTLFAGILTYAIAKVSWMVFEGPLVKFGHRFQYEPASGVDRRNRENACLPHQPEIAT